MRRSCTTSPESSFSYSNNSLALTIFVGNANAAIVRIVLRVHNFAAVGGGVVVLVQS